MFVYMTTNYCDDTYSFYLFLYPYVCFKQDSESVKLQIKSQIILYLSGGGALLSGGGGGGAGELLSGFNSKVKHKRYFRVAVIFGGPIIIGILRLQLISGAGGGLPYKRGGSARCWAFLVHTNDILNHRYSRTFTNGHL